MLQLCENELLRKDMGLAGQQRIKKYYAISGVMDDYLKVYEKAVATWQESVLS